MPTANQRIAVYQERINELLGKIEELKNLPHCPLCGSEMRKSPKNNTYYCLQEMGHCGAIILNKVAVGYKGSAYYSRTAIKDGKVTNPSDGANVYLATYFIKGKEVSKEEYLKPSKG